MPHGEPTTTRRGSFARAFAIGCGLLILVGAGMLILFFTLLLGRRDTSLPAPTLAASEASAGSVEVALTSEESAAVLTFDVVVGGGIASDEAEGLTVTDSGAGRQRLQRSDCEATGCIGRYRASLSFPPDSDRLVAVESVEPQVSGATTRSLFAGLTNIQLEGGAGFYVEGGSVEPELSQLIVLRSYQAGLARGELLVHVMGGSLRMESNGDVHELQEGDVAPVGVPAECEEGPCHVDVTLSAISTTTSGGVTWAMIDRESPDRLEPVVTEFGTIEARATRSLAWSPSALIHTFDVQLTGLPAGGLSAPIEIVVTMASSPQGQLGGPPVEVLVDGESRGFLSAGRPAVGFTIPAPGSDQRRFELTVIRSEPTDVSQANIMTITATLTGEQPAGELSIEEIP